MFQVLLFFIKSCKILCKNPFNFNFCRIIKKWENKLKWFLQRILHEIMKKIILGTSDAWWMSHLSQWSSERAYYIVDCRIFRSSTLHGSFTFVKMFLYGVWGVYNSDYTVQPACYYFWLLVLCSYSRLFSFYSPMHLIYRYAATLAKNAYASL